MKRAAIAVAVALVAGTLLGSRCLAVPLRTFSVDAQGNQHCSGLRHGENFEVFCLSTNRPWGESAPRNVDRASREWIPPPRRTPSTEDRRAPWAQRR